MSILSPTIRTCASAIPALPPNWVHIDDLRARERLTYGEALLAALSSDWARLDGPSGGMGVVVSDRGQFRALKRWAMLLSGNRFVPPGCEDAETVASWHTLTLSEMIEACGRGWLPSFAAVASRKVWFRYSDVNGWQAPRFEIGQTSQYARRSDGR